VPCKSVLVIEDDQDIRQNVGELLESSGYPVLLAENGNEALELLRSLPDERLPGLALLDLMMPVMDGRAFAEAIGRETRAGLAAIPLLLFTAVGAFQRPETVPGIRRILRKPVDLDELFGAVEDHCGRPDAPLD
jgi:two-component system, chemotaxis family, chemotaxis protein CheY